MTRKKIVLIALGLGIALPLAVNFPYLHTQLRYYRDKDQIIEQAAQHIAEPRERGEPNRLEIPILGISAPVRYIEERKEEVFQQALQHGVVHFPGTAFPGEKGNVYIFGHSSDNPWAKGDYKTVFAFLPKIKVGDQLRLTDNEGNVYHYKVIETKVVNPSDIHVLDQGNYERNLLTLQTSYPIGTSLKRFVVIGELAETPPSSSP